MHLHLHLPLRLHILACALLTAYVCASGLSLSSVKPSLLGEIPHSLVSYAKNAMTSTPVEQPKKPASGYWLWLGDHRKEIEAALGNVKQGAAVAKKAGEMWKALSENEQKPYYDKAAKLKAEYDEALTAFKAGGGVITRKSKKNKEEEKSKNAKDPNAPKRPVGGAFGIFLNENRADIGKSLPEGHKTSDIAKAAGAKFKELSEAKKKAYQEKYEAKAMEYKKAMEDYKASLPEQSEEQPESASPSPKKARARRGAKAKATEEQQGNKSPVKQATNKRGAEDSAEKVPRAKKGRPSSKGASKDTAPEIDASVLDEAKTLKMDESLQNLAARPEIVALNFYFNIYIYLYLHLYSYL